MPKDPAEPKGDTASTPERRWSRVGLFANVFAVGLVAALWGGYSAWCESQVRVYPLDIDGWGHVIRLLESDHRLQNLLKAPSLWKGTVIPVIFGIVYYLAPFPKSVLVFNILAYATAAGVYVLSFRRLGANAACATFAVVLAIVFLPHKFIFGYYYAEPFLALLVSILLLLTTVTLLKQSPKFALATGAMSGFLLLARAPYLAVVASLPILMFLHLGEQWKRGLLLFCIGLLVVFCPWPVRNYLVYGEFIPFTTEAGKVMFLSTYLPADDSTTMETFYVIPEYRELEKGQRDLSEIEKYHYWRKLTFEQIYRDPLAQLRLCGKKALRFWMHVPAYSWVPSWKTTLFAATFLLLGLLAVFRRRRWLLVQICSLWVGGLWFFHSLTHGDVRYTLPILPLLTVLSMVGLSELMAIICRGSRLLDLPTQAPIIALESKDANVNTD